MASVRTSRVIPGTLLTEQLSLHQLKFRQERWGQHVSGLVTSKLLRATVCERWTQSLNHWKLPCYRKTSCSIFSCMISLSP